MELTVQMKTFLGRLNNRNWTPQSPRRKLVVVLNQYHSVDIMAGTETQKATFRERLVHEAKVVVSQLPNRIQAQLDTWLSTRTSWEQGKESFHI